MSALLDSLAAGFRGDGARRALLDEALRDGLPGPRSEAWKYTSLRALERRAFAAVESPAAIDPALLQDIPAPRLVFVNGRHAPALSDLSGLPAGVEVQPLSALLDQGGEALRFLERRFERVDEIFARLNAALAEEGVRIRVQAEAGGDQALHLAFVGAPDERDRAWHLRHLIELRAGARLRLVEHHIAAADHAHLDNVLAQVHIEAGAELRHLRIQDACARATSLLRTDATLAEDAAYRRLDLELGGALSRHELNVRLEGDRARLTANGVLLATGRRHLDTRLGIEHVARDTACELRWRGLGAGRGRAVFHGGILIHEGADGSDADLSNKNLLLDEGAEIDTQPVLEIHADEVKAAHGATVGRLDANALFYLQSRGLPSADAQQLLTAAFCREPLAAVAEPALARWLDARLDRALDALAPAAARDRARAAGEANP